MTEKKYVWLSIQGNRWSKIKLYANLCLLWGNCPLRSCRTGRWPIGAAVVPPSHMPCWLVALAWAVVLAALPMAGARALRADRPATAWQAAIPQHAHLPGGTGPMGRLGRITVCHRVVCGGAQTGRHVIPGALNPYYHLFAAP